ncbi:hypothetical protein EVA_10875 [gut metagenome]|uniref:Uncharacterized protein n=1 Tax=gut metagenome TaxID=749906 RepID=J9GMG8_9ZZZZ
MFWDRVQLSAVRINLCISMANTVSVTITKCVTKASSLGNIM